MAMVAPHRKACGESFGLRERTGRINPLELLMLVLPVIPFPAINPVLVSIGPFSIR